MYVYVCVCAGVYVFMSVCIYVYAYKASKFQPLQPYQTSPNLQDMVMKAF